MSKKRCQGDRGGTLASLWERAEAICPDKAVLIADRARLSYRETGLKIRVLASNLRRRWNVQKGDVVALLAPNCIEFIVCYFAITRIGAIVQPVDERSSEQELLAVLSDSEARHIIVHHALWPKLETILPRLPAPANVLGIGFGEPRVETFESWSIGFSSEVADTDATPNTIAELMYTSGTGGEPKGVMRSHSNVRAASRNSWHGFGYRNDDVIAIAMPLSHSSALNSQLIPILELGGTVLLLDKFDVAQLVNLIRNERVTCMRAVPTMLRMLLALDDFNGPSLPSLRMVINSSAPIDPVTYTRLKHRFEAIKVMNSYGLTEASTCTVLSDELALRHPDSIGLPIKGVKMRLVGHDGQPVAAGAEGEILICGEHVFAGYRNNPSKTTSAFRNGWLHTGDLAHQDEQGLYYLHGRLEDVLNVAGRNFTPADTENCLLQLPDVLETAVIGVPHRFLGEVAKAFIVPRPNTTLSAKAVIGHCASRLPSHKVPFHVEFVPILPRNCTGKVLRRALRNHEEVSGGLNGR